MTEGWWFLSYLHLVEIAPAIDCGRCLWNVRHLTKQFPDYSCYFRYSFSRLNHSLWHFTCSCWHVACLLSVPIRKEDQKQFIFTWNVKVYIYAHALGLLQLFALCHSVVQRDLDCLEFSKTSTILMILYLLITLFSNTLHSLIPLYFHHFCVAQNHKSIWSSFSFLCVCTRKGKGSIRWSYRRADWFYAKFMTTNLKWWLLFSL